MRLTIEVLLVVWSEKWHRLEACAMNARLAVVEFVGLIRIGFGQID